MFFLSGLTCLLAAAAPVSAAGFTFSFETDFSQWPAGSAGTVSGEILGLADDGTGAATSVLITIIPSGFGNFGGPLPINAATWSNIVENEFTTVAGVITAAKFRTFSAGDLLLFINSGSQNFLRFGEAESFVANENGFEGVSFKPITPVDPGTSVPGPLPIVGAAAAMGFSRKLRRRIKASKPEVLSAIR